MTRTLPLRVSPVAGEALDSWLEAHDADGGDLVVVRASGYYEWRSRAPSQRAIRHAWITEQIRAVHAASRGTYGARRVHAELTLGLGLQIGHNQVEMLMARATIKGLPGDRRPRPRHETPTATDLVERMFTREQPNRLWVTDIVRREALFDRVEVRDHYVPLSQQRVEAEGSPIPGDGGEGGQRP